MVAFSLDPFSDAHPALVVEMPLFLLLFLTLLLGVLLGGIVGADRPAQAGAPQAERETSKSKALTRARRAASPDARHECRQSGFRRARYGRLERALALAQAVRPFVGGFKVGLEFISANGPDGVRAIVKLGLPVFADVKFHDIPNTVAGAARALAPLGAAIFNVHASGGEAMMRAAVEAAAAIKPRPQVIGVTVLTSLDAADLAAIGHSGTPLDQVVRLAKLAKAPASMAWCAARRKSLRVREACGADFLIVTPGVRPGAATSATSSRI